MDRKKTAKWLGMFLVVMVLFTFLSRTADSLNVPRITTKTIQNQNIGHEVKGSGKVESTLERAVFVAENQKVEQILVQEGQSVEAGDALYQLSMEALSASIKDKEAETESLARKVEDAGSQANAKETEKALALERARENYDIAVANGEVNVANAEMEVNVAKQKLQNYYTYVGNDVTQEQALLDEIRSREEALNDVIMARNKEVLEAERALEDAQAETVTDGSLADAQAELLAAQEELEELNALQEKDGKIYAETAGVVKEIRSQTGNVTTAEAAMIFYETGGSLRVKGTISKEDAKYVEEGQEAEVKGSDGKKIQGAVVESVQEDEQNADLRAVSILLPEDSLSVGASADFEMTQQTGPYPSCVPLSALYEEQGSYYVYVVDTENTILGEAMVARKVPVNVLDKNTSMAALENGALSQSQKVIVSTDRELTDGSRVRLQES